MGAPVGMTLSRFGTMVPNYNAPGGGNPVALGVQSGDAAAISWYESGPFWMILFLVAGYILVYRTIR